jgi:hypothetical protein
MICSTKATHVARRHRRAKNTNTEISAQLTWDDADTKVTPAVTGIVSLYSYYGVLQWLTAMTGAVDDQD